MVALALGVAFLPSRAAWWRSRRWAPAILIALQLGLTLLAVLYIVWFFPLAWSRWWPASRGHERRARGMGATRPTGARRAGRAIHGRRLHDPRRGLQHLSIATARSGSSAVVISTALSHGSSVEVSKRTGILRGHRLDRLLALDPDHAAARPGHPHVGDVGGPAGQDPGVGGGHVGVGADARR